MWDQWIGTDGATAAGVLVSAGCVYALIILYTRLAGLRSFSKMTAPDFAMTVAVGSMFGSAASSPSPTVLTAAVALGSLFASQKLIARVRQADVQTGWLENEPVLLVDRGTMDREAMRRTGVTEADIRSKLREANATGLGGVRAVVFESTGDVSVLHGEGPFDDWLLKDVRGAEGERPAP